MWLSWIRWVLSNLVCCVHDVRSCGLCPLALHSHQAVHHRVFVPSTAKLSIAKPSIAKPSIAIAIIHSLPSPSWVHCCHIAISTTIAVVLPSRHPSQSRCQRAAHCCRVAPSPSRCHQAVHWLCVDIKPSIANSTVGGERANSCTLPAERGVPCTAMVLWGIGGRGWL